MKPVPFLIILSTLTLAACDTERIQVPERDWANTTYLFASDDEAITTTYYKPYAGYVGDPMPFYDARTREFRIGYLQDYRPNPVGTYHPIWGVRTTDAARYESLGELIPCGGLQEQDAALGTGCFVYDSVQSLYYCFYTGHKYAVSAGENREAVQYATSPDFRTWTKNTAFVLRGNDYGYSSVDFRDPCVFRDEAGQYHLLVSTKQGNKGVLAEFTSVDLRHWTHAGVFMSMMWDRFYECPDVFRMGEWWYLVYSDQTVVRRVQYFKARTLDELKACTAADAGLWPDAHEGFLDSRGFYAGKTASDGTTRYIWGWCPTRNGKDNTATQTSATQSLDWAGTLVAHRLLQHEDGSLTLVPVEAIRQKYTSEQPVCLTTPESSLTTPESTPLNSTQSLTTPEPTLVSPDSLLTLSAGTHVLFPRLGYHNRLSLTVRTQGSEDHFGLSFRRGTSMTSRADSSVYYTLSVHPESPTTRKINFEQEGEGGIGFVPDIDSYVFATPADNTYHIEIFTDNSVLVLYINDVLCYTNRIYGIARNCWSVNAYTGTITLSDIHHYTY